MYHNPTLVICLPAVGNLENNGEKDSSLVFKSMNCHLSSQVGKLKVENKGSAYKQSW